MSKIANNAMSEEEPNLSACMQKLKIMPRPRPAKTFRDEELPLKLNPFVRRHRTKSQSHLSLFGPGCACKKKGVTKNTSFKRLTNGANKNKLLREPVILLGDKCTHSKMVNCKMFKLKDITSANSANTTSKDSRLFGENMTQQDFKSIIAGCEQLSLSNSSSEGQNFSTPNFRESRSTQLRSDKSVNVNSSSCSQQAMARLCLNPPCDVTIDELASYFETFVHIPKKMSSMAEMMYI